MSWTTEITRYSKSGNTSVTQIATSTSSDPLARANEFKYSVKRGDKVVSVTEDLAAKMFRDFFNKGHETTKINGGVGERDGNGTGVYIYPNGEVVPVLPLPRSWTMPRGY